MTKQHEPAAPLRFVATIFQDISLLANQDHARRHRIPYTWSTIITLYDLMDVILGFAKVRTPNPVWGLSNSLHFPSISGMTLAVSVVLWINPFLTRGEVEEDDVNKMV